MFPAEYEVEVWNEIEEKIEIKHGVTIAESFSDAMEKIENYYGDEINAVNHLVLLEDNSVYEFEMTNEKYSHGIYKIEAFSKW